MTTATNGIDVEDTPSVINNVPVKCPAEVGLHFTVTICEAKQVAARLPPAVMEKNPEASLVIVAVALLTLEYVIVADWLCAKVTFVLKSKLV